MSAPAEGWGWPSNARKAHYFVKGRSLCGKWAFLGTPTPLPGGLPSQCGPDDCAACHKELTQHLGEPK